ncbi:hypothetical protein C8R44DRAFT_767897 [Mycena epipterygia]|nr:hypothetical protein C8R44DRAFT_767897 [Mycena epipterygia]
MLLLLARFAHRRDQSPLPGLSIPPVPPDSRKYLAQHGNRLSRPTSQARCSLPYLARGAPRVYVQRIPKIPAALRLCQ